MIFHEYSYRRGRKKMKKKDPMYLYLVFNHSSSIKMVLIFNDKASEWHDTQTDQKHNKNKHRIVKA